MGYHALKEYFTMKLFFILCFLFVKESLMTEKEVIPSSYCPSVSQVETNCQEKCHIRHSRKSKFDLFSSSCIHCVATVLPESCEIPCTFCVGRVAFHWIKTCGGFASTFKEANRILRCIYAQFAAKDWIICNSCIPTNICWLRPIASECKRLRKNLISVGNNLFLEEVMFNLNVNKF